MIAERTCCSCSLHQCYLMPVQLEMLFNRFCLEMCVKEYKEPCSTAAAPPLSHLPADLSLSLQARLRSWLCCVLPTDPSLWWGGRCGKGCAKWYPGATWTADLESLKQDADFKHKWQCMYFKYWWQMALSDTRTAGQTMNTSEGQKIP